MTKLAIFQGVSTPISDLARAIQDQGWQLGKVQFDSKLNAFTAEALSPHGETVVKTGPDESTAVSHTLLAVTRKNHMRTTAQYKVGMWRTDWHERQRDIAEAYRDAPIYDPKAVAAWKALGDDSMHRLHVLSGQLHIEPTHDPHPYKSADEMRKDVHDKRHYYLTSAGSAHPVWTSQQVAAFRAVHDILGHGVAGGEYDLPGRIQAAHAHAPLLEPIAQQALFSEAVARPAFIHQYGSGPAKVALFPEFFDHNQDENNPSAHRGVHPSQSTAPVALPEGFALQGKTAQWGNTIDVNKGWESGVDPLPVNAYVHHGDPMQYKATMDNAGLIDTGWSKFQKGDGGDDRERMKLAIVNAFRVVLLSPRKDLRWNAIHYQDISNIPGGVDDPKVYWDTLESSRRRWNEAQGIDPEAHMIFYPFLKPFEARIAANHPEKGWEWAKQEAKQVLFNWWTEEQERIQAEDSKKPAEKQRGADEIERRANEALARRLQLFLKPKDEKTDVEDTQMSMFGSIHNSVRHLGEFDYDALVKKNVDSWNEFNDLEGYRGQHVGWVPTEVAAQFAEYDRRPGGKDHMHFPGYWDALRSHIQQHGFKSPLYLDVSQDRHTAHMSEGNHRIQIAQELGLPHVPVIMFRSNRSSSAERPINLDITQFPEDRYDPTGHRMPDMFHPSIAGLPTRDHHTAAGGQYNLLTGEESLKYGAFMGTHLKAIAQISQHADEILDAALADVREHDAEGHHFRNEVLKLGVSGVGPKVCSFAWLLLQPMTSQLATIDTHMMDVLGHDYEKEMNNRDYFKFEREFRAGLDAAGYAHMPLGAGQWGMWDYKRTGPGSHQDHSAMRVLDPKPHGQVDWVGKAVNLKGESWHKQAPDWWQNTQPAREAVGNEWDQTYGKEFAQNQIPYQGLQNYSANATISSRTAGANPDEFHVSWNVPAQVLDQLYEWASDQGFSNPEPRSELHMTALYLPEGHSDKSMHSWINSINGDAHATFNDPTVDFFPSQEDKGGVAVVVKFEGDEGKALSERLLDEAEEKGKEVKRFPGGYKPHITVAYADVEPDEKPDVPAITFKADGLSVSSPRKTARTTISYADPFKHYWEKEMPVGSSSLDSKAKKLAEIAKAKDFSHGDLEEWLTDHRKETRLNDEQFSRFSNKCLRKLERLSKTATDAIYAGRTPSFIHPETLAAHHGMPGQTMMEHARLQTGLSTQEIWRLLADEHVHKA